MKREASLLIYMKVKGDRVEAKVKSGKRKKTYVFPFGTFTNQSNRISLLLSSLPLEFFMDAYFENIKK